MIAIRFRQIALLLLAMAILPTSRTQKRQLLR